MGYNVIKTPTQQAYDLPVIGDDLQKIGRIIDLYAAPCKPTPEIWVYGFFSAIPTMFATLTKPELIDINIRHGRGKPRKGKRLRFLGAIIARDAIFQIPVPRWVVFRGYEFAQRIGWYFLVADATESLAINWMTLAYKYNGCNLPQFCYWTASANQIPQNSGGNHTDRPIVVFTDSSMRMSFSPGGVIPALNGRFRVTYDLTFEFWFPPPDSELPLATFVAVNGINVGSVEGLVTGVGKKRYNGSLIVDVFGGDPVDISIRGYWNNANKFSLCSGKCSVDRIDGNEIGPDP